MAETFTEGKQVPPTTEKLRTGDFVWEPERSPGGPVLIVVSKPEQVAYVYRNGIRIAPQQREHGRPGHPTPVGVFDILEKERDHVSTIYKGAEMPWMERLTWNGIAMHAGDLPGYPDSHGCVRLPLEFSKLLLHRDHERRNGHNCGCNVRPARDGASGDDFFAGHTASRG